MKKVTSSLLFIVCLTACKSQKDNYDASGTFEAVETIVSAEASGIIKELNIEEGQVLQPGQYIGYIDSTQLHLKWKQLEAQAAAVLSRKPDVAAQTGPLKEQLIQAEREQKRIARLVKADAATPKQLDDANTQIAVIKRQIAAQESSLNITSSNLNEETVPLNMQMQQVQDQLAKCRLINEVSGTVLTKFAETNEVIAVGKPIYKIAALNAITLRAYITGTQLTKVKTGQQVTVLIDTDKGIPKSYAGTIEWISSKAEFTPKTIQTKEERANLVYAIKVKVKNDGMIKIGMYGDLKF
jgi:HlyD family secretion protein